MAATSPKNGDTCIFQNPDVKVTFNSGSEPSNVTTDNFKVTGPYGVVAGQVSWDASTRTATWITQPTNGRETKGPGLDEASNYTATISGFTGGPYSFTFQTGPCKNVYPATVQLVDVGTQETTIFGINNNGALTGEASDKGASLGFGFIWNNGQVTKLKGTGYKINDSNSVSGMYAVNGIQKGFLYQNGQYTDVIPPSATGAGDQIWAYGINNMGVVVGYYVVNPPGGGLSTKVSGFVRQPDGSYSDFKMLPKDINNFGHIALAESNVSELYTGTYNPIVVCGQDVQVEGLNNSDDTVGYAVCNGVWDITSGPYVKRGGTAYQVVVPGCRSVSVYGINDKGQVVGSCGNETGGHGFIATPK